MRDIFTCHSTTGTGVNDKINYDWIWFSCFSGFGSCFLHVGSLSLLIRTLQYPRAIKREVTPVLCLQCKNCLLFNSWVYGCVWTVDAFKLYIKLSILQHCKSCITSLDYSDSLWLRNSQLIARLSVHMHAPVNDRHHRLWIGTCRTGMGQDVT